MYVVFSVFCHFFKFYFLVYFYSASVANKLHNNYGTLWNRYGKYLLSSSLIEF